MPIVSSTGGKWCYKKYKCALWYALFYQLINVLSLIGAMVLMKFDNKSFSIKKICNTKMSTIYV